MSTHLADSTPRSVLSAAPAPEFGVEVVAATKLYGPRPALREVSISLQVGGTLALVGPNGAGKTTLLRVLATLVKLSSGEARVRGLDTCRDAHEVRHLVGYMGHQPLLYDELTARENLLFFARMYGLHDGEQRASTLLARVGLAARASDRVHTLSRGQFQRLALARSILHDPAVLLLDEPDTGLDDDAAALLVDVLEERRETVATTIFTTHQPDRGLALADKAVALVAGRVAFSGPAAELTADGVRGLYRQKARRPS
jgi:heme exporter protein A